MDCIPVEVYLTSLAFPGLVKTIYSYINAVEKSGSE